MNKNPLLVKSFLQKNIPFSIQENRGKYGIFFKDNKLIREIKGMVGDVDEGEVLSAYTLGSNYVLPYFFNQAEISFKESFSKEEWIFLNKTLLAYKEVEGIELRHLVNCFYKSTDNLLIGYVNNNNLYTFYTYSIYSTKVRFKFNDRYIKEFKFGQSSQSAPIVFWLDSYLNSNNELELDVVDLMDLMKKAVYTQWDKSEVSDFENLIKSKEYSKAFRGYLEKDKDSLKKFTEEELLKKLEIFIKKYVIPLKGELLPDIVFTMEVEFSSKSYQHSSLFNGIYSRRAPITLNKDTRLLIPQPLRPGEYSPKLIEFISDSLITPKSDSKLIKYLSEQIILKTGDFWEDVQYLNEGIYNKDGYIDRRYDI